MVETKLWILLIVLLSLVKKWHIENWIKEKEFENKNCKSELNFEIYNGNYKYEIANRLTTKNSELEQDWPLQIRN